MVWEEEANEKLREDMEPFIIPRSAGWTDGLREKLGLGG